MTGYDLYGKYLVFWPKSFPLKSWWQIQGDLPIPVRVVSDDLGAEGYHQYQGLSCRTEST